MGQKILWADVPLLENLVVCLPAQAQADLVMKPGGTRQSTCQATTGSRESTTALAGLFWSVLQLALILGLKLLVLRGGVP